MTLKYFIPLSLFANLGLASAALTIGSSNNAGFDANSSAIVDNSGSVLAVGGGYIGVGSFGGLSDADIGSFLSSSMIDASFSAVDSTSFNLVDGLWESSLSNNGDTSSFDGNSVFTVIGNGSSIADSDQFLIYKHNSTFVSGLAINDQALVAEGVRSTGTLILGGHDNFDYDFGAGAVAAFNLISVPEPSSSALLALAGVGFVLRRRR